MSYQFHGQRAHEDVLLVSKQHPFVLFHPLFITALIFLLPGVVYVFVSVGIMLSIAIFLGLFLGLLHAVLAWYAWRNTTFLLTNERVVFLHQKSLLQREFVECTLSSIQQVSHEVKGIAHTIFGYGTITITTGGGQTAINIKDIPDPYEIQQEIQRASSGENYIEGE